MRVLLVEDTEDVAEAIVANFSRSGHAIDRVTGCGAARDAVAVQDYDLVILDINLPDGSGFDFLRALRSAKNPTPILVVTARREVEDRIGALDIGADDYLMKPFDLRELEARARALIRRSSGEGSGVIEYGKLSLDPAGRTAGIAGTPLQLTRREFSVLEILMLNRGRVMPKERIFEKLFSFDREEVGLNAVELYIARLRRKLAGSGLVIRNLRGLGYQIALDE
ncbi:response regulator transcription factor [Dongia deserti]|uniref:response regulator transcription factor n=1 Tax=Dongia deserti TaxID=2268030 RepID=UPI000E659190|nr:response regulator transcription factor [Dongia deserti]